MHNLFVYACIILIMYMALIKHMLMLFNQLWSRKRLFVVDPPQTDHSAGQTATTLMHVKLSIFNLSRDIYLNIFFCFNRIVWYRWNVERTWDMTL